MSFETGKMEISFAPSGFAVYQRLNWNGRPLDDFAVRAGTCYFIVRFHICCEIAGVWMHRNEPM